MSHLKKKKQEHFSQFFFVKKEVCVTFNEGNAPKKEGYKTNINNSKWDSLINRKNKFLVFRIRQDASLTARFLVTTKPPRWEIARQSLKYDP